MMALPRHDMAIYLLVTIPFIFIQTYALFFALTLSRWLCLIAMPLLWGSSALSLIMIQTYGIELSKESMAVFFEATPGEALSFIHIHLVLWVAASALVALVCCGFIFAYEKPSPHNRRAGFLCLIIALGSIVQYGVQPMEIYAPYYFLKPGYEYGMQRVVEANNPPRTDISALPLHAAADRLPQVVVLVIGESARADHFSLNGYMRQTNPLLAKRPQLVSFTHASSCGVWTRISLSCMLTRATRDDRSAIGKETSVISLFRKLGFYTAWFSTQGIFSGADPISHIQSEVHERHFISTPQPSTGLLLDEQLLPGMDKLLARYPTTPLLIILHTQGSHWQYDARYPPPFTQFTPVCGLSMENNPTAIGQQEQIEKCGKLEGVINGYDNSILYTDYVIDQVITRLEKYNALMVYVSDHGESLGEQDRLLHGHADAPENYHIPMIWWASEPFLAQAENRKAWNRLTQKERLDISHDHLFHSLLGCVGATGQAIDRRLDLCQ